MAQRSSDLGAALTGLVVGITALFAILFAVVQLTNSLYASKDHGTPSAQTSGGH